MRVEMIQITVWNLKKKFELLLKVVFMHNPILFFKIKYFESKWLHLYQQLKLYFK